jgi:hypothetical protein
MLDAFRIRPLTELDLDKVIEAAGGIRAHPDADRRDAKGADYRLGGALIEFKALEDEGLAKPERQSKLAALFRKYDNEVPPVVVLDREALPEEGRRNYDRILEGPIKNAVGSARKQLKQSRIEYPDVTTSILLVLNNGYTALDHKALLQMVTHRARNDSQEIDGIVVGGMYVYSDGFDTFVLAPLEYIAINLSRPFPEYEKLNQAWGKMTEEIMTAVMIGEIPPQDLLKGPVIDTHFTIDGITYIKPAPPMGEPSDFYVHGRPRKNSTNLTKCPPVGLTFPEMTRGEWQDFRNVVLDEYRLSSTYEAWLAERQKAVSVGAPMMPFVPIPVTCAAWQEWCAKEGAPEEMASLEFYARLNFDQSVRSLMSSARERTSTTIVPAVYVLVSTQEIGQDKVNDLSHIAILRERPNAEPAIKPLAMNLRIFHEHALALACAYAVANNIGNVLWQKDLQYGWI